MKSDILIHKLSFDNKAVDREVSVPEDESI